ncbi:MAG: coenzyme F430 synthase [Methanobacteriaceae archaeon]|nr:coenzyme F430 synthase [Methanobacteriaceae archaeon]
MKVLVVDMTHGGKKIALEFLKAGTDKVYAYDIYKTLPTDDVINLSRKGIIFVDNVIEDDDLLIVAPVHSTVKGENQITHHDAVQILLSPKIQVPVIEVTGVKGKTSTVWMLKEIFKELNPLVLSSLGIEAVVGGENHVLEKNISITPANIVRAWELAEDLDIGIGIFEASLGGTGLANVGILTNLAENYPIANNTKTAGEAKKQIFKSDIVACEYNAFKSNYSDFKEKIVTFGYDKDNTAVNVGAVNVKFGLNKTSFKVIVNNLKTIKNGYLSTEFNITTFAPAEHHLNNVLAAICGSLILEVPIKTIQRGLKNYRGVKGRTSIKKMGNINIIEEINPGINVKAIEKSFKMISQYEDCAVILGGKYGITCEEIDEEKAVNFLNRTSENINLILVDDLGMSIKSRLIRSYKYFKTVNQGIKSATEDGFKNILLIYRSNFSEINKR